MEPLVRFERTTYWLQVSCSTSWAKVAYYLVTRTGIEPMSPPWKGDVLTAWPTGLKEINTKFTFSIYLVSYPRLERGTTWLKVKCSTTWANSPNNIHCNHNASIYYYIFFTMSIFFLIFFIFFAIFCYYSFLSSFYPIFNLSVLIQID